MTSALSGRSTALPGASRAPGGLAAHLGRGSSERLSDLWAQLAGSVCLLGRRGLYYPYQFAPIAFRSHLALLRRHVPLAGGGSRTADLETEPRRPELETCSQFTTTAPTACLASAAGMAKMTTMAPRRLATLAARWPPTVTIKANPALPVAIANVSFASF
eukprot:tig00021037_g17463.t1